MLRRLELVRVLCAQALKLALQFSSSVCMVAIFVRGDFDIYITFVFLSLTCTLAYKVSNCCQVLAKLSSASCVRRHPPPYTAPTPPSPATSATTASSFPFSPPRDRRPPLPPPLPVAYQAGADDVRHGGRRLNSDPGGRNSDPSCRRRSPVRRRCGAGCVGPCLRFPPRLAGCCGGHGRSERVLGWMDLPCRHSMSRSG